MAFISKAIGGLFKAVGLVPKISAPVAPAPAPTVANSTADLDAAAQQQAAAMQGGKTSTMLTGGAGEEEDPTKTSKVLLGS